MSYTWHGEKKKINPCSRKIDPTLMARHMLMIVVDSDGIGQFLGLTNTYSVPQYVHTNIIYLSAMCTY